MSDRDEVRGLAREILSLAAPTTHLNYPAQLDDAERRLLAFLAQREAALQGQLHRALEELNLALACQEGLSDQVADLQATVARLEGGRYRALGELGQLRGAVADPDPEAGIMPHWIIGAAADLAARFADPDYDVTEDQLRELTQGLIALHDRIDRALTASPLSERAGAVIVAAIRLRAARDASGSPDIENLRDVIHEVFEAGRAFDSAVDAFRAEQGSEVSPWA